LIEQLRKNGLYELVEKEKERMKAFKLKLEKRKAKKEELLLVAKRLKSLGSDVDFIKKATGLSKRDIDKVD